MKLKLKLLLISRCGVMGHRGTDATESVLREEFVSQGITDDVAAFAGACLHCIVTRTGETVPRPLGHTIHGEPPRDAIQVDFMFMRPSYDEYSARPIEYLLLIRDDLSRYVCGRVQTRPGRLQLRDLLHSSYLLGLSSGLSQIGALTSRNSSYASSRKPSSILQGLYASTTSEQHTHYRPMGLYNVYTTRYCPHARLHLHKFKLTPKDWHSVVH